MSIEAMKQALEALEVIANEVFSPYDIYLMEAITALRTAIEQAEKQEPVAWVNHGENRITRVAGWDGYGALYTTPPAAQRQHEDEEVDCPRCGHCCPQRQPLTDEWIAEIYQRSAGYGGDNFQSFARAIEAAHGITGDKK